MQTEHTAVQVAQSSASQEDLLGKVANEFFECAANGDQPRVEDFAERYPQIAEQIRLTFPALELVGRSEAPPDVVTGGLDAQVKELGDFRIIQELGRGGMGVVYEAEQISMGRRVALKMLPFATLGGEKPLQRFRNEVRAAATLDHPNIVSVYSVGEDRGIHYFAMQLIRGSTVSDVIGQLRRFRGARQSFGASSFAAAVASVESTTGESVDGETKLADNPSTVKVAATDTISSKPTEEFYESVARLGVQTAEALQFAHERGVIHRDIKPANLLVDATGDVFVTDFGLARIEADAGVTLTGDLVGTLRYMSPEQASGSQVQVDHRTDIYSLGATLYELATLQAAFPANDRRQVLKQIAIEDPAAPRRVDPSIPTDLETIILKAMSKAPEDRYASGAALSDDLKNFLDHRPLLARRPSSIDLLRKWTARHPVAAQFTLASLLLLSAVLAISLVFIERMNAELELATTRAKDRAEEAAQEANEADRARQESDALLYAADVRLAADALGRRNVSAARERLARHIPQAGEPDRRGFAWHYVWNELHPEELTVETSSPVRDVCYSPDGGLLACGHDSGLVTLREAKNGRLVHELKRQVDVVRDLAFSPDGAVLATASDDGTVVLWRVADGNILVSITAHQEGAMVVRFGLDGTLFTAGDAVKAWRGDWQHPLKSIDPMGPAGMINDMSVSPTGDYLAVAVGNRINLIRLDDWSVPVSLRNPAKCVSVAYSPDGKQLIVGQQTGHLTVWNVSDRRKPIKSIYQHRSNIYHVAFSSDGRRAATASKDMTAQIWDTSTWSPVRALQGHSGRVYGTHFAPNEDRLVTASSDSTLKFWRPSRHAFRVREIAEKGFQLGSFDSAGDVCGVVSPRKEPGIIENGVIRWPSRSVIGGDSTSVPINNRLIVYSNLGLFQETENGLSPLEMSPTVLLADVDADGDLDRVSTFGSRRRLLWEENLEPGDYRGPRLLASLDLEHWSDMVVEDFQGDDKQDVVFVLQRGSFHRGNYAADRLARVAHLRDYDIFDMNSDRRLDILFANDFDLGCFIRQPNTPIYSPYIELIPKGEIQGVSSVKATDLDKDGTVDVICASSKTKELAILKSIGELRFDIVQRLPTTIVPFVLDVHDVNQDGHLDVLVAGLDGVVWFQQSEGRLEKETRVEAFADSTWQRPLVANVAVLSAETLQVERAFFGNCESIYEAAISPDGRQIATAGSDHVIRFWSSLGKPLASLATGDSRIRCMRYSNDGKRLCAGVGDYLHIYDTKSCELLHRCEGHQNTLFNLCIASDDSMVATASNDLSVRLWSLETGERVRNLVGHSSQPLCVAFSGDNRLLASGDESGTVRIWDTHTGHELLELTDFEFEVDALAFSGPGMMTALSHEPLLRQGQWTIDIAELP